MRGRVQGGVMEMVAFCTWLKETGRMLKGEGGREGFEVCFMCLRLCLRLCLCLCLCGYRCVC